MGPGELGEDAMEGDQNRPLLRGQIWRQKPRDQLALLAWSEYIMVSAKFKLQLRTSKPLFLELSWCLAARQRLKPAAGYINRTSLQL